VDSIMKNEFSILGLTALKEHDEYTYAHCVNVSLLSVAMGQVLGLSRSPLANLGVAALLHDLGKIAVPTEILRKSGTLSPDEWASVRRHPLEGVKLITHVPGLSVMTLDAMWVNLQHHMNVDGSGYPTLAGPRPLKSLARVVSVADCFDALTAHRAYRPRAFTGHEALQQMAGPDRAHFDPAALWALVRSVGLYPAGSVLLTASGYRVLSLSPNRADLWRPYCRVLQRPDGSRPDTRSPETWDPMPATERVARALTPEECPVKVAPLLAA
jgi:HD-GYP domain-containing protein (c-di-GMP phosphodiesterase class II)